MPSRQVYKGLNTLIFQFRPFYWSTAYSYWIMCPYVQLEPKYTYTVGHDVIRWPSQPQTPTNTGNNIWTSVHFPSSFTDALAAVFAPASTLPTLGTGHNNRIGNKITLSSLRYRIYVRLHDEICCPNTGNPFSDNSERSPSQIALTSSLPVIPKRWFKMRLFVIQFDNTYSVTPSFVCGWFYSTFLPFSDNQSGQPSVPGGNIYEPVSVHSKLLRMSSNYSGNFNILLDKCFTIYSNKPQILLDYTVPLNMQFSWRDDGTLQTPKNIVCFILPPMNWDVDVDPWTAYQYRWAYDHNAYADTDKWFLFDYFTKVNFTDL